MAKKRNFKTGALYHIYNRGNHKQIIFGDFFDNQSFIRKLGHYSSMSGDRIICYVLMPNHFHVLVKAHSRSSISTFMHRFGVSYGRAFASRYKLPGHVFQSRYRSKHVRTLNYLIYLSRYIHRNPLEVGGVTLNSLEQYPWSSYRDFCSLSKKSKIKIYPNEVLRYFDSIKKYQEFCAIEDKDVNSWILNMGLRRGLI